MLIIALLRARGIDARLALVRTLADALDKDLPGLSVFNYAIVFVPGKGPLFIDADLELATAAAIATGPVPDAAMPILRRALDTQEGKRRRGENAYVWGRIAEHLALCDMDRELYREVPDDKGPIGLSTLVERRLSARKGKGNSPGRLRRKGPRVSKSAMTARLLAIDEDLYRLLPEEIPYAEFATALQETCLVGDPWYDGRPIFRTAPIVLSEGLFARLYEAGARVGRLYQELVEVVLKDPSLLDAFYRLPPFYKLMWLSSDGLWHGFARMDMFLLEDGSLKICELNADTPSGQVEALVPTWLLKDRYPELSCPNDVYEERFFQLLLKVHRARTGDESVPRRACILYPTDLSEDITLIRLYQRWLEERGIEVVLGSPFNLHPTEDGGVGVLGERVDLVLRHYKTDWWGERPPIFADEGPVPDPDPLDRELAVILGAERRGKVSVVNPFGALIPQNKRSMALFWEEKHRFSPEAQASIEALVPETFRLESLDRKRLKREKDFWVLKSDFGCEGDEVLVGPYVDEETWGWALESALEGIWVAQRFFRVRPLDGMLPNFGVFLIAGRPSGLLVRLAPIHITTGHDAQVVSPFVRRPQGSPSGSHLS